MIYRWHAAISNQDEAWAHEFMKSVFGAEVNPGMQLPIAQSNDISLNMRW